MANGWGCVNEGGDGMSGNVLCGSESGRVDPGALLPVYHADRL